jgi:hypothetical protein
MMIAQLPGYGLLILPDRVGGPAVGQEHWEKPSEQEQDARYRRKCQAVARAGANIAAGGALHLDLTTPTHDR